MLKRHFQIYRKKTIPVKFAPTKISYLITLIQLLKYLMWVKRVRNLINAKCRVFKNYLGSKIFKWL